MKVVIKNSMESFAELEQKINNALKSIKGYCADKWASPIISVDKTQYACPVEIEGMRGEIMAEALQGEVISEIERSDEFWFKKIDIQTQ